MALVGFLIFVLLSRIGIIGYLQPVLSGAIQPFQYAVTAVFRGASGFFSTVKEIGNLQNENRLLEKEIIKLKSELAELSELANENVILRKQLGFTKRGDFNLVPAEVISNPLSSFLHYLVINKGTREGLREGMAVVSEGILVGKLKEVSEKTSKVFLITDPTSSINAIVQNSRAQGIVKGQIGGGLEMQMIPQNEKINAGDLVVTSALSGDFPRGILIGEILEVKSNPNDLFQKADLISYLDFRQLEMVFIITGTN